MIDVAANLALVRENIVRAAEAAGRDPAQVSLIAVSKLQPLESIRAALEAGQRDLGENYAQELRDKADALAANLPLPEWHFLGALQSNKVKYVVGRAGLIHTCDSLDLAREISKRALGTASRPAAIQRVLIEVNLGREAQKHGVAPEQLPDLLRAMSELPGLRCEGLMCIPPAQGDPRLHFAALRRLRDEALEHHYYDSQLKELSMGMSADYQAAIAEGATLVRVGTAIFGARPEAKR